MTVIVALADARLHLADLIEHVTAGEEIIVVQAGLPVARLVPMAEEADQSDPVRARIRHTLQAGFSDPMAKQVQWAGA